MALKSRFGRPINPMNPVDRGCLCKRRFATKEECQESIRCGGFKYPLRAYKCDNCGEWHKTKHKAGDWRGRGQHQNGVSESEMSENGKGRQEKITEKKEVMVYMPIELYEFLLQRCEILGLSRSAVIVNIVRREKFHVEA